MNGINRSKRDSGKATFREGVYEISSNQDVIIEAVDNHERDILSLVTQVNLLSAKVDHLTKFVAKYAQNNPRTFIRLGK